MRRRLALLALLAALAAGCSHRDRANPFDPENPHTQGRPAGFTALAGDGVVTLRWQPVGNRDVLGFQLYRRAPGDADYRPLGAPLAPSTGQLVDSGLENGQDYRYRLYYLLVSGLAGSPAEDIATPGALRPWVSDEGTQALYRLTPDARHVLYSEGSLGGPTSLAVDVSNGVIATSDTYADRVVVVYPTGNRIQIPGLSSPAGIVLDPLSQTGWVCDSGGHRVLRFNEAGQLLVPSLGGITDPLAAALDPQDASLWVCDNFGNAVWRFSAAGTELWRVAVERPSRVAVDSLTREGWVTSFSTGRVVHILSSGVVADTLPPFEGPIGVDVDPRRGRVWVAEALGDRLVALDLNGAVEFAVPGLSEVREVAADRGSGDAWATVPGRGAVVRVSPGPGGPSVRWLLGLGAPNSVALDPGTR